MSMLRHWILAGTVLAAGGCSSPPLTSPVQPDGVYFLYAVNGERLPVPTVGPRCPEFSLESDLPGEIMVGTLTLSEDRRFRFWQSITTSCPSGPQNEAAELQGSYAVIGSSIRYDFSSGTDAVGEVLGVDAVTMEADGMVYHFRLARGAVELGRIVP